VGERAAAVGAVPPPCYGQTDETDEDRGDMVSDSSLYDVSVISEWVGNPQNDIQLASSSSSVYADIVGQLGLSLQSVGVGSVPKSSKLPPCSTTIPVWLLDELQAQSTLWKVSVSPDSNWLVIIKDTTMEVRRRGDEFESTFFNMRYGSADLNTIWKCVSWSPDSKFFFVSNTTGDIDVFSIGSKEGLIGTFSTFQVENEDTAREQIKSQATFVEPLASLMTRHFHDYEQSHYEIFALRFNGLLECYRVSVRPMDALPKITASFLFSFSFADVYSVVTCAVYDPNKQYLLLNGVPCGHSSFQNRDRPTSTPMEGISFWKCLPAAPHFACLSIDLSAGAKQSLTHTKKSRSSKDWLSTRFVSVDPRSSALTSDISANGEKMVTWDSHTGVRVWTIKVESSGGQDPLKESVAVKSILEVAEVSQRSELCSLKWWNNDMFSLTSKHAGVKVWSLAMEELAFELSRDNLVAVTLCPGSRNELFLMKTIRVS
jgi:hypothetical protein